MMASEIEFTLPLGYVDRDGKVHRQGKMRPATAYDELSIQADKKNPFNIRYRDILMLCRVIVELGEINPIEPHIIEGLFEMDFLYLQMLYREVNSSYERKIEARCPNCGNIDEITMADLFTAMHYYYKEPEKEKGKGKGRLT
jgi:hypothetical protein